MRIDSPAPSGAFVMWTLTQLQQAAAQWPFETRVLMEVDSTSGWLKRVRPPEPLLVIAYAQTGGYGQRGRSWQMRPGRDLTFSIWLPQAGRLAAYGMLTPYVAYRLREHLQPFSDLPLLCKWPNDLYTPCGKVSGTLIERQGEALIVGTGVNWVRTDNWPHAVTDSVLPWDFLAQWGRWVLAELPRFSPRHWQQVMGDWVDVDWFPRGAWVADEQDRRYRYGGIQTDGSVLLWQGRQAVCVRSGACSLSRVDQSP